MAVAAAFLAPFLFFYVVLKLWPIVYGFWISLHRWETIGMGNRFVGLQNYERIAQDRSGRPPATRCCSRPSRPRRSSAWAWVSP